LTALFPEEEDSTQKYQACQLQDSREQIK